MYQVPMWVAVSSIVTNDGPPLAPDKCLVLYYEVPHPTAFDIRLNSNPVLSIVREHLQEV
jgi:hypothetical protein